MLLQRYERNAFGDQRICKLCLGGVKKSLNRQINLSAVSRKMRKDLPGKGRKEVFQPKEHEVFLVPLLVEGLKFCKLV